MEYYFRLKDFREKNGIDQRAIAALWGINQGTVSRIETEYKPISAIKFKKLEEKYGAEAVSAFVGKETIRNAIERPSRVSDSSLAIIRKQQETIERLTARVEELTNLLLQKP